MIIKDEEKIKQQVAQEKLEKQRERNMAALVHDIESNTVTVADDAGYDVTSLAAQMGRPMTAETVIAKLKQCNSKLHFERSINFPHLMGIYLLTDEGKKHICGMEASVMPEFTVIHKTKKRMPVPSKDGKLTGEWQMVETYKDQTRGWRTVLVRLLHSGFITEGDVAKHFGWAPSRDSKKWQDQTQ